MKTLHVITSLYTGGAETLVVNLIPRFWALGYDVDVVVFNAEQTPLMDFLERECPKCNIYRLGHSYYNPWYIFMLIRIMRNYDVVHTHNSSPQLFAAIANIICRKILVTTEHNTYNRKRGNRLLSLIDKWMYSRYNKIVCISDQAEENIRSYLHVDRSNKTRICTIFNGVDVRLLSGAKPIDVYRSGRFVVVMVAAFRRQKDHKTLIKAMTLLPKGEYELWLVGDGECYEEIKQYVRELHADTFVKFWGNRTDVPNILKAADVVVLSTHYEGLSLANIEGMASGKPFIATDVEGVHEVTDDYGILVAHENPDALAKAIQLLHDDKIYYQKIVGKCLERARQFDINEVVNKYNELYLSLF